MKKIETINVQKLSKEKQYGLTNSYLLGMIIPHGFETVAMPEIHCLSSEFPLYILCH